MPGKYEHIVKCQLSRRQVCNPFDHSFDHGPSRTSFLSI
jgi:hypothetical protein